ncbi:hypothetical protein ACIPIX_05200 [Pseudomonas protegens]|uniref:hypothetical protein n=1 Tax=Pseudomonas protegens TaxID=380021 RepID=UPI003817C174
MATDYSKGYYKVFSPDRSPVGRIDKDEFIRSDKNALLYRVDGDELYSMKGDYLGFIDEGVARATSGQLLFTIEKE